MRVILKHILQGHSQVSLAGSNTVRFLMPQAVIRNVNRSSGQSKQVISPVAYYILQQLFAWSSSLLHPQEML